MVIRFIGDVHGKYNAYKRILKDSPPSVQVGDMGVGFMKLRPDNDVQYLTNPPYDRMVAGNHKFIRGNHDNPAVCRKHSQYIADGTYWAPQRMMFVGGASSVDRALRTEGVDWWADEELSIAELNTIVDDYIRFKPKIMVTHDCPEEVAKAAFFDRHRGKLNPGVSARTRQAFQSMFSAHSPDLWVYGHWHAPFDHVIGGTRFLCLAELEFRDIEVGP